MEFPIQSLLNSQMSSLRGLWIKIANIKTYGTLFVLNCRTKISELSVRKKVFSLHGLHGLQSAWSAFIGRPVTSLRMSALVYILSEQLRTVVCCDETPGRN